jgi:hypothetical protein
MTMLDALDGNAIAGLLFDAFGDEMTSARSVCGTCGVHSPLAELAVYHRGPGAVVRCRSCTNVQIVLVVVRGTICADLRGLAVLEPPPTGTMGRWA